MLFGNERPREGPFVLPDDLEVSDVEERTYQKIAAAEVDPLRAGDVRPRDLLGGRDRSGA